MELMALMDLFRPREVEKVEMEMPEITGVHWDTVPGKPLPEPEAVVEEKPEFMTVSVGRVFHGMMQMGSVWVPLNTIKSIDFNPSDGCGAEIVHQPIPYMGTQVLHLSQDDADALEEFLIANAIAADYLPIDKQVEV